jgi:hypothetical protein
MNSPKVTIEHGSHPVLRPDPRHAAEFADIVGDDDQAFAAGMTADLARPNRDAMPPKPDSYCGLPGMMPWQTVLPPAHSGLMPIFRISSPLDATWSRR